MNGDAERDLDRLAELSSEVAAEYVDETAADWEGSPFNWIRQLPSSRTKGKVGESLVKAWAISEGIALDPPQSSDHDVILNGILIEVKFSLRWAGGEFVFQQIRDQDYEVAGLLGLEPKAAHLWFVPKSILRDHATPQHGGQAGRDTKWLRFNAGAPPDWLREWGGSLLAAKQALEKARRVRGD